MTERSKILCFAAHPDDIEVYMGATLLLFAKEACRLRAVILTDGEAGTRQPSKGTRKDEAQASLLILGMEGRFPGLRDGGLSGQDDLEARLQEEINGFDPDLVFGPNARDAHEDHAALARALEALRPRSRAAFWQYLDATEAEREPSHLLPMDDGFGEKEALIRLHISQFPTDGESRAHLPDGLDILERAERRDRRYGQLAGLGYAEPLLGPVESRGGPPRLIRTKEDFFRG